MVSYIGQETMPVGVVLERRPSKSQWIDYVWRAVAVIPRAPAADPKEPWRELVRDGDVVRFHAGTLPLRLFRKETEGYKLNLSQHPPQIFVVLRRDEDPDSPHETRPFQVTACPYEAQIYMSNGDDVVDPVVMPEIVAGWVMDFIDRHHAERPIHKRKRRPHVEPGRRQPFEPPLESPPRRRKGSVDGG